MIGSLAVAAAPGAVQAQSGGSGALYGLIGKMKAVPGQRDQLVSLILGGADAMPGCLSYIVALDTSDDDTIWVTEVWDSQASHRASLSLPAVRNAISAARGLIAEFVSGVVTEPVGGVGLDGRQPR